MRVYRALSAKETFYDEEETKAPYARADCSEVSEATYCRWRNQYGGMKASEAKRLKELEDENRKLKEIVAEKELDIKMLKHLQEGNW